MWRDCEGAGEASFVEDAFAIGSGMDDFALFFKNTEKDTRAGIGRRLLNIDYRIFAMKVKGFNPSAVSGKGTYPQFYLDRGELVGYPKVGRHRLCQSGLSPNMDIRYPQHLSSRESLSRVQSCPRISVSGIKIPKDAL